MHKLLAALLLAVLVFPSTRVWSQIPSSYNDHLKWGCGSITSSSSGSLIYEDFGYGFRFQFPSGWVGGLNSIHELSGPQHFLLETLFAASDPKLYLAEGAKPGATETINGLKWTELIWPNGDVGSYTYHEGVLVSFLASAIRKDGNISTPTESLVALKRIQSTFTFFDDSYRMDRQLAAFKVGQRLGGLTISRIVTGAGGFGHPMATVEFSGQLTVAGVMVLPSPTMLGGWGPYRLYPDDASLSQIPQLKCPIDHRVAVPKSAMFAIGFTNQDFTNQQFAKVPSISGPHDWYEADATVSVGSVEEKFGNGGILPEVTVTLIKVINKESSQ